MRGLHSLLGKTKGFGADGFSADSRFTRTPVSVIVTNEVSIDVSPVSFVVLDMFYVLNKQNVVKNETQEISYIKSIRHTYLPMCSSKNLGLTTMKVTGLNSRFKIRTLYAFVDLLLKCLF
jgi:hypothetical protein